MTFFGKDFEKDTKKRLALLETEVADLKAVVAELLQNQSGDKLQEDFANVVSSQGQQSAIVSYRTIPQDIVEVGKTDAREAGPLRERIAELETEVARLRPMDAGLFEAREQIEKLTRQLAKAGEDLARANSEKAALENKNWNLQSQLDTAQKRCASLMEDTSRLFQEVRANENRLIDSGSRLEAAQREVQSLKAELAAFTNRQLKDQASLFEIQDFLDKLGPTTRAMLMSYYDFDSLPAFLTQCGQFSRLNQVWEACGKIVANGGEGAEFARTLEKLLALYNQAAGDSPAQAITTQPGEPYKSGLHFRVRSDGSRVARQLLPGLRNAGGKTVQQVLVTLE